MAEEKQSKSSSPIAANLKQAPTKDNNLLIENKFIWLEEIIRETEHYYQGESQQDQRASWLLATSGVLIAVISGLEVTILDKGYYFTQIPVIAAIVSFTASGILSILTILPMRGTRSWVDLIGRTYYKALRIQIDELIKERFRHDEDWSMQKYEDRIKYHYRSHYLRFNRKSYGILWASVFLCIGLVFFAIVGISMIS